MFDCIRADIMRFSKTGSVSLRIIVAGLLSQGFQAILVYRFFHWLHRKGISGQPLRFICERFIEITCGISIPACCVIGKGFRIHHFGGIIFHPSVEIGENCTIYQGVTIGDRGGSGTAAKIGNNVLIGAGAKIIGEITINDHCRIGANAVVTRSMPDNTVAMGPQCLFRHRTAAGPDKNVRDGSDERRNLPIPRVMDLRGTYKGGGGPDKTVLHSAARHDPDRVQILVTYLRQPLDSEFRIDEMARQLGINYVDVPDSGLLDFSCLRRLASLIREHDLNLIHAHDDKTLLYAWMLKIIHPGVKIMFTCHSHAVYGRENFDSVVSYLKFRFRQKVLILLMGRYEKPILTVSHDTRTRLVTNGLAGQDVAVLHNGIDLGVWRRRGGRRVLREELGIPDHGFLVGTVARICYDKDLQTFYRVACELRERVAAVTFVIVGDGHGDELQRARQEVARLGLDDVVRFTGHRTDLLDIYESLDVFLMTSRSEGLPNTLLEAMAIGVPAVSTSVGGVPELLIHGCCGFLAPVGAASELASHVEALLSDHELLKRCSRASRQRVEEHFSFNRRVSAMEEYYAWYSGQGCRPARGQQEVPDHEFH